MRQISFKGKRKDGNGWAEGCYQRLVVYGVMKHFIAPANSLIFNDVKLIDSLIEIEENTISQYWRSVNKIDLYDGDIFTINGKYSKIIRYKEDKACFCVANLNQLECEDVFDIWQIPDDKWWNERNILIDVIGNEFDNPELLNHERPI